MIAQVQILGSDRQEESSVPGSAKGTQIERILDEEAPERDEVGVLRIQPQSQSQPGSTQQQQAKFIWTEKSIMDYLSIVKELAMTPAFAETGRGIFIKARTDFNRLHVLPGECELVSDPRPTVIRWVNETKHYPIGTGMKPVDGGLYTLLGDLIPILDRWEMAVQESRASGLNARNILKQTLEEHHDETGIIGEESDNNENDTVAQKSSRKRGSAGDSNSATASTPTPGARTRRPRKRPRTEVDNLSTAILGVGAAIRDMTTRIERALGTSDDGNVQMKKQLDELKDELTMINGELDDFLSFQQQMSQEISALAALIKEK